MKTFFLRVLDAQDKAAALLDAIRFKTVGNWQRFDIDPVSFATVPRSPFAYWVSERLRRLFKILPALQAEGRVAAIGASTKDDGRFLRTCWEVPPRLHGNIPFAKGGAFSPFYADVHLCIRWRDDGFEAKTFVSDYRLAHGWSPHWKAELHNPHLYFRAGLTWPRRTQGGLSLRAMPAGCIFADKGPAVFAEGDGTEELLALLAVANCRTFKAMVDMQMSFGSYEVGVLQLTPVPRLTDDSRIQLSRLARRAWSLKRSLDTTTESSHAFTLPALLQVPGDSVPVRCVAWLGRVREVESELLAVQCEIDEACFAVYDVDEVDCRVIGEDFGDIAVDNNEAEDDTDEETEKDDGVDATLAAGLVSWAVGVAFGRFDIRIATGAQPLPPEPDPFDPLAVCSPGMLSGEDGMPSLLPPAGYPLTLPGAGFLVDDPGHAQDLPIAVRGVFDSVFGAEADRWWSEVVALLDTRDHELRRWLASNFFEHHIKRYSKSRRKAPIIWQLATASGHYSVWLYAHSLTRDSFFQIQNEVIGSKLSHEERQLTNLIQSASGNPSSSERKEIAAQEAFVEELREMLDEVKRIAPLWSPNLDDGVLLTMAPLWRLVPQHKPWQKELKSKWNELVAGKYDWAHIALYLWPERVVPKCLVDRSIAIAHGLEREFWTEEADGKWKVRQRPLRSIEEVIRAHTSPAVKVALKGMLDAPVGSGTGRRAMSSAATKEGGR